MPQSKGHILIVEPNGITRKLIAGILTARGYETYEATGGDEALAFLAKSPVLIILDVDGDNPSIVGLLHKLKRDHGKLAVVAMSEEDDADALKARLGLQNISLLDKPVVPESLLASIESHLLSGVEAGITKNRPAPAPADLSDPSARAQREFFMRRAIDLAQEAVDAGDLPFGAVIVRAGKIAGEGRNRTLSDKDPTAHAEMGAIRAAARALGGTLEGCEIYTSSEPCPMCLAAAYWARVDRVFYGNTVEDARESGFDDEFIYRELAQPEHKRTLSAKMFLREEAKIVLADWVKKGGK